MSEPSSTITRWLKKQHVVSWCAVKDGLPWCSNAFYVYDEARVVFYILTDPHSRHGQMTGDQAMVAGTVNGQPKTVGLIRGVQFRGEIRRLNDDEAASARTLYCRKFPVAMAMPKLPPLWEIRLDELKFTDNTLGFGKKISWVRDGAESDD